MKLVILFGLALTCSCVNIPVQYDLKMALLSNYFGHDLYQELKEESSNLFYSPLSIAVTLGMLYGGAGGKTREQIKDVMRLEFLKFMDIHEGFRNYLSHVEAKDDAYTLSLANSAWLQEGYKVSENYQNMLKAYYFTSVHNVDFSGNGDYVREAINNWVSTKTNEKISELFTDNFDPLTKLILVNAIYFKGTWQTEFDHQNTILKVFYNNGDVEHTPEVPMMHLKTKVSYWETDDFQAISLPYKGNKVAMMVVLPTQRSGLEDLENNLTPDQLSRLNAQMWKTEVNIQLPKFKLEYSKKLSDVLQQLGLESLFGSDADLSNLTDGPNDLQVSEVTHKAVVEVNEQGSEAAAVTGVEITNRMGTSTPDFVADHPFLFYIVDTRFNLNLFVGRIKEL